MTIYKLDAFSDEKPRLVIIMILLFISYFATSWRTPTPTSHMAFVLEVAKNTQECCMAMPGKRRVEFSQKSDHC